MSGHHLSLTRLQDVLALGPGEPVEIRAIDNDGSVRLSSGDQAILRYHHAPQLLRRSLEKRRETPDASTQSRRLDFGDHPEAALLGGDVLRIGEDYFWSSPELPAYCWMRLSGKRRAEVIKIFLRNAGVTPMGEINTVRGLVADALRTQAKAAAWVAAQSPVVRIPVQPEWLRTPSGLESVAEKLHDSISGIAHAFRERAAMDEQISKSVNGFTAALYGSER